MNLETTRMIIRNFVPEDAAALHEILSDEESMKFCEPAYDLEKTTNFLHSFCIGRHGAVAAVQKESNKLIGYILFNEQEKGVYEMGWFFNRSVWRQGYAYEACRAVLDHAFATGSAHKVFAETIDPVKSVRLMQKLGMQPEGSQRSQVQDPQGNWADLFFYGLRKEDWNKHSDK